MESEWGERPIIGEVRAKLSIPVVTQHRLRSMSSKDNKQQPAF